jgi:AraC-like DNA-binding protein
MNESQRVNGIGLFLCVSAKPGEIQGKAECSGIQQSRHGTPFCDPQRGPVDDRGTATRSRVKEANRAKDLQRTSKGILKQLIAGQRPGIQDLARELHLSTRTLQRRLTDEGTTFQCLLDDARRELARHYLLHSTRELNETAYLLGYEDANSFLRAFHNWEGTSPGQWRLLHTNSHPRKERLGVA